MHTIPDWHEIIFISTAVMVLVFYACIFTKTVNKPTLLLSVVILVVTAIVQFNVSPFPFYYTFALLGLLKLEFLRPYGLLLFSSLKSAYSGLFEEFFRSVFVVLYVKIRRKNAAKKNKVNYTHIKTLDNQVYGLAFLYGIIESGRMVLQVFPGMLTIFQDRTLNVDILGTSQLAPIHPVYIVVFACAIILRYYIHLRFLQLSIYSLAAKRKWLYLLALLFHFSAGAIFGFYEVGTIERTIISLLVIEIIFVGIMTLLLSKFNLREQIIAKSMNKVC